ncbi:platelet glycoprotein 4-like [Centruroides vittatus]|uniref:platelet glycoprotein 4-like n=1 Tax=Centruroides vittatus TaxID=120091 RepID=UPI003510B9CF
MGPYVYRIRLVKNITNWGKDNETLTYDETVSYHFEEKLSKGKETDEVYLLNLPAVGIAGIIDKEYSDIASFIESLLKSSKVKIFKKLQVKQLLFGYKIDFLEELAEFDDAVYKYLPDATFGLFYKKNNSVVKNIVMNTGIKDKKAFGLIQSINNKTKLDIWPHEYCNMINGSDGIGHPQPINEDVKLKFFVHLLQRSFTLEYVRDSEIEGIPTMEFTVSSDTFDTQSKSSEQKCFCDSKKWCDSKGVFSYKLIDAVSVLVSRPYFVGADSKFRVFKEFDQDEDKYKIHFQIQPLIGFTLGMAFTLQLNIVVKQSDNLWYLRKMNETVFPVAWFTQSADLPEDFAKEVYDMIMTPQIYGKYAVMLVIGLGIMGISSAILNNIYPIIKKKKPSTPSGKILPINKNTSKTQVEKF